MNVIWLDAVQKRKLTNLQGGCIATGIVYITSNYISIVIIGVITTVHTNN